VSGRGLFFGAALSQSWSVSKNGHTTRCSFALPQRSGGKASTPQASFAPVRTPEAAVLRLHGSTSATS
jgi:hypothetical protein